MLLSTATKAEIRVTVVHDSFIRTGHLTSSVGSMVTGVIVKRAHDHSVLCGLAFPSIYRNLCVTVAVSSRGTNLSTSLLVSGVSCHHHVSAAAVELLSRAAKPEGLPAFASSAVKLATCKSVISRNTE